MRLRHQFLDLTFLRFFWTAVLMPRVSFGSAIQRHVAVPALNVEAETVRDALAQVFERHPLVKSYVLDDQGSLRKHMHIFISGASLHDRKTLTDAVARDAHIYVVQALSGG